MLGTSSHREKGAVWIQCYMKQGDIVYVLYDDLFGINEDCAEYEFDFIKGNTITRTLKFSRFPTSYSDETTKAMPKGEYHVRVKLNGEQTWTETDIVINAK